MQDDPIFSRVRAARPTPPSRLLASIARQLPVRARASWPAILARPRVALVAAFVVAVTAIAVAIIVPLEPWHAHPWVPPEEPAPAGTDAGVDAQTVKKLDPVDAVRSWAVAMRGGDVDAAAALTAAPFTHAGVCANGRSLWDAPPARVAVAGDARAVRELFACIKETRRGPFFHPRWSADKDLSFKRVAAADLTQGEHLVVDRDIRKRALAIAADHELVVMVIHVKAGGTSATNFWYVVAVDRSGKVDAVLSAGLVIID